MKNLKAGLLQKIFPKNGEDFPEVRFPEFTDAWEQRKLGEVVNVTTGKLDANAMVEDGKFDFYTSGIKKYRIDVPAFEGPAITIAGNGATAGYMHLADGKFNAYQRTYVLTDFQANREFLFSEIGKRLPKKIAEEARTGNIPYIVMDMLTELSINIPSNLNEQKCIGQYFSTLDHLITLHQRKLEHLQEQKKALLQQMFI
ncbi:restriction endonuclease subunit S [Paenibacillus sp. NRS-1783]|uniref:restriction endonuclease subunit S n=1 Tax=Paenibacillus sp. NRS-1783 TaxID=3233907 RepID=UPI003D2A1270